MQYEFDVAFSFCQEDLSLAFEIEKNLSSSIKTFVYANKQELLVGRNGPAEFSSIFKSKSRLVVILYRKKYGNTEYTAVEKDAISARALKKGWDFVLLLPLDKPLPDWYPETYIYLDPISYKPEQIAGIIEYKLRELGAEFTEDTLEDKVLKIKVDNDFNVEKEKFLNSPSAYEKAQSLFEELWSLLKQKVLKYEEHLEIKFVGPTIRYNGFRLRFEYHKINSKAKDSYLLICTEKTSFNDMNNRKLNTEKIFFDYNKSKLLGWSYKGSILNSDILSDKLISELLDKK